MRKRHSIIQSLPAALALGMAFAVFRLLPLDAASALGGRLGRLAGPRLKWHRIARANLERVWPEHSARQRDEILAAMWDNLGRNLAEYPWLGSKKLEQRIDISMFPEALPSNAIFAAGHLGNWELAPLAMHLVRVSTVVIYRRVNNSLIESMIYRLRRPYCLGLYPKGKRGAAEALRALRTGKALGLLIDQKMNDGTQVPFFGHPAMTAPAVAELAQRFNVPILLGRVVRQGGAHFRVELIEMPREGTPREVLMRLHTQLEQWITECPGQWLWVHQRWGKINLL